MLCYLSESGRTKPVMMAAVDLHVRQDVRLASADVLGGIVTVGMMMRVVMFLATDGMQPVAACPNVFQPFETAI
jgi:hypothetical protein